ncbi:MAG: ABC transporter substrate-binding protein, partial [Pseudomonadota bacterium]
MKKLDQLKGQLAEGKLSRRRFMEGALALGATVVAAERMMGEALAAPKAGGSFRQGLTGGGTSDTLDPAQILDSYMINVSSGQLRNNLTEIAPDGSLRAELAESWEASDDAASWTFKIRKGVEFHNGKSMEPNDVAESFRHHMGEDTKSAAKGIVQAIKDVRIDGDNVVFELEAGNADFPYLVSDYHLNICPAKDEGGIDWESGVGTGGYALESFDPGVRTLVKRNPNYWKENAAYFDEVENLFIADVAARTNALRSQEIDSMSNLDLKTAHLLERDPNVSLLTTYGNKHTTMPMDTRAAPFDNNDVRLALKYALNRQELVDKIARGYGEIGNDHPIGPANIYRAT